jgi:nucleotide-binding universal stress UspA family protein
MPTTIVVGVNGDPGSRDALALARTLQPLLDADVVVAAIDTRGHRNPAGHGDPPPEAADLRIVAAGAASVARGLREVAAREDAVLLVAGATHRTGLARHSRHAGGERLLAAPGCALAFAPPGYGADGDHDVRVIGAGFDGGMASAEAVRAAAALAVRAQGTVRLFTFTEPTLTPTVSSTVGAGSAVALTGSSIRRRLDAAVEELLEELPDEVRASGRVELGEPIQELVQRADEVDLLALGSHGRGALDRAVFGSVAEQVVHAARAPVIVFPPATAAPFIAAALAG